MRTLIIRRLLGVIPVIIGMTMLTFFISHIIPSDPARLMAGPKASPEVVGSLPREIRPEPARVAAIYEIHALRDYLDPKMRGS